MGAASGSTPLARHGTAVLPAAFSPDGSILATGGSDHVRLWDGTFRANPGTVGYRVSGSDAGDG
jgi:hypothetical protein